jgi:hypothetical protein
MLAAVLCGLAAALCLAAGRVRGPAPVAAASAP